MDRRVNHVHHNGMQAIGGLRCTESVIEELLYSLHQLKLLLALRKWKRSLTRFNIIMIVMGIVKVIYRSHL